MGRIYKHAYNRRDLWEQEPLTKPNPRRSALTSARKNNADCPRDVSTGDKNAYSMKPDGP